MRILFFWFVQIKNICFFWDIFVDHIMDEDFIFLVSTNKKYMFFFEKKKYLYVFFKRVSIYERMITGFTNWANWNSLYIYIDLMNEAFFYYPKFFYFLFFLGTRQCIKKLRNIDKISSEYIKKLGGTSLKLKKLAH